MKRISQRDIAKKLGINASTVSRALRGLDGVSPNLRQQIEQLAEEQGYHPNPFAMSLRFDTTRTIGIVVPDISYSHNAHIVKHIEAEARKRAHAGTERLVRAAQPTATRTHRQTHYLDRGAERHSQLDSRT